ncbi:MAG: lamin tail domain-containing protein, partial [Bacteroidota bacterium]
DGSLSTPASFEDIDVSGNNSLVVRFDFNINGSGDGFDITNVEVTTNVAKPEPTNHPTNFIATAGLPSTSVIDLVWTDANAGDLPDGYLIAANDSGTFLMMDEPVDGTDPPEDTNLADGSALIKVAQGTQAASFSGLTPSTQYFFKIWPYSNSGSNIDFKINEMPETADATTDAACGITALGSASVNCTTNTAGADNDAVTVSIPYTGVDANASLIILVGVSAGTNDGDDPASVTDGTITFDAMEGDSWSVTISGGTCSLNTSGSVGNSECDPPPAVVINEILADPASGLAGDANGDGVRDTEDDEFIEIYNTGNTTIDISSWTISDAVSVRHTFPASTLLPPGTGLVVFGGGLPAGIPVTAQTASSGALGFSNSGDDITLADDGGTTIDNHSYGGEGGNDESLAREPDFTGSFVQHSAITTNPVAFSPGADNTDGSALPIELTYFQAKRVDDQVALTWQTSSEINNHYMTIERSQDGRAFQEIGRVEGAGTTNTSQNYSLIDQSPANGINYYRLRQVDFDGTMDYSEVVSVDFKAAGNELTVRPTEASTWVTLELSAGFPENGNLQVFDLNGRLLYQQEVAAGAPAMDLDVRNFAAGQYVVRLVAGSMVETQRFFKR